MYPVLTCFLCMAAVAAFGASVGAGKGLYSVICLIVALIMFFETRKDYKKKEARLDGDQRR